MKSLSPEVVSSMNTALQKLTGYIRREYAAELCEKFFDSSPRKMERYLRVSRDMVSLAMHERLSGIRCLDAYVMRGAKKKRK